MGRGTGRLFVTPIPGPGGFADSIHAASLLLDRIETRVLISLYGLALVSPLRLRIRDGVIFDARKSSLSSTQMSTTNAGFRNFLSLALFVFGIGTLGFAAYAFYTDVRYPLGALNAADVQGLKVELVAQPKGPQLHVTGTISDSGLAVRRVIAGRVGKAMWLKIYPMAEQQAAPVRIDLRVQFKAGAIELRFGPGKELIWRSEP
jgi:hypothetical protein